MLIKIKNIIGIVLNPTGRVDFGLLILRVFTGYLMFTYHGLSKIIAGPEKDSPSFPVILDTAP